MALYIIIAESVTSKKTMYKGEVHDEMHFTHLQELIDAGAIEEVKEESKEPAAEPAPQYEIPTTFTAVDVLTEPILHGNKEDEDHVN